jgi:hypothetical protein
MVQPLVTDLDFIEAESFRERLPLSSKFFTATEGNTPVAFAEMAQV